MATTKAKYRENAEPQLSANQLAQYLSAGPSARKRIIRDARWQPTVIVARYRNARDGIIKCLCDPLQSHQTVAAQIIELQKKLLFSNSTSWKRDDLESSIAALERFAATVGQTQLPKLECVAISGSVPPLNISGVKIKVTPDVTVRQNQPNSENPKIGALITVIAKGEKSGKTRKDQAVTVSTLLWMFAQDHLAKLGIPERKLCMAYDVFDGVLIPAPTNYLNRFSNIQAACEEIISGWAKATPPADWNG